MFLGGILFQMEVSLQETRSKVLLATINLLFRHDIRLYKDENLNKLIVNF